MDYLPNSHAYKKKQSEEAEKKKTIEKVVSGTVTRKKKTMMNRIADILVPEDVSDVKTYVFEDIFIPLIKDAILGTVETFLHGRSGFNGLKSSIGSKQNTPYHRMYQGNTKAPITTTKTRTGYEYEDIVVSTRGEAEEVLVKMNELIYEYEMVSVNDLYDLVGITGNHTDCKWGWTDISTARAERLRDGRYWVRLPKPLPL